MTLFFSSPPVSRNGSTTDGPISLGVEFKVTGSGCTLNGFRFYQGGAPWTGTVTAALYAVGGTTPLTTAVTVSTAASLPAAPVASASSEPAGGTFGAAQAIDSDPSTRWLGTAPTVAAPQWLRITYSQSQVVTGYSITGHPSSNTYSPTAWKFQGSNDGSTWTDLDTRSGVTWGALGVAQSFTFANSAGFTQYRILITANNGATDFLSIAELVPAGIVDPAWREATLSTPFPLTSGTNYRAVLLFSGSRPTNFGNLNATLTSGPLTVPSTNTSSNGNHTFAYGAAMQNPLSSGGSNYMIDVIVEQSSGPQNVPIAGQIDAISDTQGAISAAIQIAGQVDFISGTSGALTSGVTAPLAGQVDAVSGAQGDLSNTFPITGQVDVVSGLQGSLLGNHPADAISAHSTTQIASRIGSAKDGEPLSAGSVTRITSSATVGLNIAIDPVTGRPQYRLIVVDSHGTPLGELENASIGDPVQKLGQAGTLPVSLPSRDPKATLLDVGAQVQVWAGSEMLPGAWFVLVQPGKDGSGSISYDFVGLEGLLDNVVIGDERPELLKNGGFEEGLRYWHPTWLEGSAAQAPPKTTIVGGSLAKEGGKALQVEAVESVNVREVKTAAIFYGNRPYVSEPLAAGFLPGGEKVITDQLPAFSKGTALLVEGFTADVDSGDGQALSQRRANAAKAVIVKARPDLKVTAVGRGESIQVAPNNTPANQAKNRRILLTGTATRVGHRQIIQQFFTWTNTSRVPIELELDGDINLIDYVGPSKDRYGFYINRRKGSSLTPDALPPADEVDRDLLEEYAVDWAGMTRAKAQSYDTAEALYAAIVAKAPTKAKIVQAEHTDLPEDFPHERWTVDGTSDLKAPPDSKAHLYEVRLYGSAGKTIFDNVSVKPNLRTGFYNVTRPQLFAGLVAEAQNTAHGKVPLNLEANCPAWGVHDDYEYEWKTPRTVWDAIEEQLRADDAPDFGIVTTQTRRIATTWAKRGRRSEVQFRLGEVVTGYTAGVDGDKVATTGIVTSNRSRGPGVVEARVRTAPVNGLVFERVQAAEPDRSRTRLRQMAAAMTRYGRTDVLTSVTCDPKRTVYLLGHVGLGDRVWCSVHDGDTHAEGWYRIVEIRHSLAKHQLSYELTPEV